MRKPAGASRYDPMSNATFSFSRKARQRLRERGLAIGGKRGDRRIDHLQADAGVRAGLGDAGEKIDPWSAVDPVRDRLRVGVGPRNERLEAGERLRPLQRVDIVLDAQHRRRVDGLALENAFDQLAALGKAEDLRQRPRRLVRLKPLDRARAQDDHAVPRFAAERLLPGERRDVELGPVEVLRESGGRRVAERQALAVGRDPIGVGDAHPRGGAVPGEHDVVVEVDLRKVRQLAIGRLQRPRVLELELLDDVGDPALAEAFPGQHVDAARAEQRPQGHFDRAGVGPRRDADAVIARDAEHFARQVDRELELGFGELGAMRASQRRVSEELSGSSRGALRMGRKRNTRSQGERRAPWSSY